MGLLIAVLVIDLSLVALTVWLVARRINKTRPKPAKPIKKSEQEVLEWLEEHLKEDK